jgi:glycosyltransferase involved in cell wall biosynthesis
MKIAFITPSVSRSSGGIFEIELALAKTLHNQGLEVEIFGQNDEYTSKDLPRWGPIKVHTFPSIGPHSFRYSPLLKKAVVKSDCSIAHLHVIWMYTSIVVNHWHKTGKPYMVTINGMLEPWALKNARWKKKIVEFLYEKRCLNNASCLHANTYKEYTDIRKFGLNNPVCIIPNGVELPVKKSDGKPTWHKATKGRKVLLFIGRLHPKKGIIQLLQAWAELGMETKDWCLVIAGWGDKDYCDILCDKTKELNIINEVIYAGPQFDEEKHSAFSNATAFILPSFSEGLPMAVLEAWSYQLPTLISPACNLPEAYTQKAAIKVEPNKDDITCGLKQLFLLNESERSALGTNAYALIKQRFTWDKIAVQLTDVYKWIKNGGEAPNTVLIN